jgi:hypothetical protein
MFFKEVSLAKIILRILLKSAERFSYFADFTYLATVVFDTSLIHLLILSF